MGDDLPPRNVRRGHPDAERTDPPPRHVPGVPERHRLPPAPPVPSAPGPRSGTPVGPWYAHWSPTTIATAVGLILTALGGATGLRELLGSAEATRAAIAESEARILAKIEEQRAVDQRARDELTRSTRTTSERLELVSSLACALNEGPAHSSWPCDLRLVPPPAGNLAPKWTTAKPWPEN